MVSRELPSRDSEFSQGSSEYTHTEYSEYTQGYSEYSHGPHCGLAVGRSAMDRTHLRPRDLAEQVVDVERRLEHADVAVATSAPGPRRALALVRHRFPLVGASWESRLEHPVSTP
jgi:hypothetical protein